MIEITTFGLMVLALIAGALGRDLRRANRDRARRVRMDLIALHFARQPVAALVSLIGEPYETAQGLSGRALLIWKRPPNEWLPEGSGLLTVVATVEESGLVSEISWRDRT